MDNTNKRNRNKHGRPTGAGVPPFHSLWLTQDVIDAPMTKDKYLESRNTQRSILSQISAIAHKLSTTPEPSDDSYVTNIDCFVSVPLVSEKLFDFLIDNDRLPESYEGGRIVYELDDYRILVGVVPSACHDYAAASFTEDLLFWAASGGVRNSLQIGHGARTPPICISLTLVFPWAVGSKKSPENSFRPRDLQSPPGRPIGNTNVLYPTFTVEVAKSHQSWDRLIADADTKHFANITGVMVWLGIKIYPAQRMRVCLLERDTIQGFGSLDPPLASTNFIDTTVPCEEQIMIPKRLIFHGVPIPLVPPTSTPDYVLDLEIIREAIHTNFGA